MAPRKPKRGKKKKKKFEVTSLRQFPGFFTANISKGRERKNVDELLLMFQRDPEKALQRITALRDPRLSPNFQYPLNVSYFDLSQRNLIRLERRLENLIYTTEGNFVKVGHGKIPKRVRELAENYGDESKEQIKLVVKPRRDSFRRFDILAKSGHYEMKTIGIEHADSSHKQINLTFYLKKRGVKFISDPVAIIYVQAKHLSPKKSLRLYKGKRFVSSGAVFPTFLFKIREPNIRLSHLSKDMVFRLAKKRKMIPEKYISFLFREVGRLVAKVHSPEKGVFAAFRGAGPALTKKVEFAGRTRTVKVAQSEGHIQNIRVSLKTGKPYLAGDLNMKFFSTKKNKKVDWKDIRVKTRKEKEIREMLKADLEMFLTDFGIHSPAAALALREAVAASGIVPGKMDEGHWSSWRKDKMERRVKEEVEEPLTETELFEPWMVKKMRVKLKEEPKYPTSPRDVIQDKIIELFKKGYKSEFRKKGIAWNPFDAKRIKVKKRGALKKKKPRKEEPDYFAMDMTRGIS